MSRLLNMFAFAALGLLLAVAPVAPVKGQEVKPVAVVSIASVEKQRQDISYLAELVGKKEDAEGMLNLAPIFLNGVDMKRPSGAYVVAAPGNEFKVIAFVPVTKLETVLNTFKEQLPKPMDAGDGVLEFDAPGGQSVFVKEVKGWAFLSNDKESLGGVPADPTTLLGTLPTTYNIAIQANIRSIPEELRRTAIDAIQSGLDQGLEASPATGEDRELAERMGRLSAKQLERMIQEVDQITIGWGVDRDLKATYFDFQVTGVQGTSLARQFANMKDSTSSFAGFLLPGASVNANGVTKMSPEDIEQNTNVLQIFQERAKKEIDNDAGLEADQRATAKELVDQFFGVLTDTVKGGTIDYGAALILDDKKLSFAGGILVADGKKLETAFAKLVDLAKNEPDFPEVKLNAGKYGNVTLHTVNANIPEREAEARMLFGEKLNVVVGTAPKALYFAFGKDGESLMKKAIDSSAAKTSEKVPPSQLNVYLKPIIRFAASMDDSGNPILAEVVKALDNVQDGQDEVNLFSKAIPNGVLGRLQVNEGVLQLIGAGIDAAQKSQAQ